MEITLEERKKYLEKNKNKIEEHCYLSAKENYENIYLPMKENLGEEMFNEFFPKDTIDKEASKMQAIIERDALNNIINNHEENVNGIELHPYLAKLRNNDYESVLYLVIKNGDVLREILIKGELDSCSNKEALEAQEEAFKEAKENGAGVYICHNHPFSIGVCPSGGYRVNSDGKEIEGGDYLDWHTLLPELEHKYNVKLLDYGVVSEFDYFSLEQSGWKNKPRKTFLKQIKK